MRPVLVATVPWTAQRTRPDSGSAHRSARYSVCIHLQGLAARDLAVAGEKATTQVQLKWPMPGPVPSRGPALTVLPTEWLIADVGGKGSYVR
jgi:hypothetical protein